MTNDILLTSSDNASNYPSGTAGIAGGREPRPRSLWSLCGLAVVVGIVGGFGAVFFRGLIALVHNLLFLGHASVLYDATRFTASSPWGAFVILVPVIGSLGVTFLVNTFAPEARGHGVPEVMDAIYYQRGVIRPIVAAIKSLASALAIGSGAAVGREGPSSRSAQPWAPRWARASPCQLRNASRSSRLAPAPALRLHSTHRSAACCSRPS
jgi:H+/Cl- antiporter ClcA